MWGDYEPSEKSDKAAAARAASVRMFEAVLYDDARFSYFLDFLSLHNQAHKLLFWFEVEQFKLLAGNATEMLARQESLWEKYFAAAEQNAAAVAAAGGGSGSSGDGSGGGGGCSGSGSSSSDLGLPAPVVLRAAALYRRALPCGYLFCVAQAFAYRELRDVWFPRFRASPTRLALLEHLRMSYPLSLPQLLVDNTFHDCLQHFLSRPGECPTDVRANFELWSAVHTSLRPLCASVFKTLEQRGGAEGLAAALGHLLEESGRFRERLLTSSVHVRQETRNLIAQRLGALKGYASTLPLNGTAARGHEVDAVRTAVQGLGDVLLQAQQQAYRSLERELLPALRRSPTFAAFVEDMFSMECAPLQARLILLNHVTDVLRKRPDRCQESSVTGKVTHLLRPAPTPRPPVVTPFGGSSSSGGSRGGAGVNVFEMDVGLPLLSHTSSGGRDGTCGSGSCGSSRSLTAVAAEEGGPDAPPPLVLGANTRRNKSLERDLARRSAGADVDSAKGSLSPPPPRQRANGAAVLGPGPEVAGAEPPLAPPAGLSPQPRQQSSDRQQAPPPPPLSQQQSLLPLPRPSARIPPAVLDPLAGLSCPQLVFAFEVRVEEASELIDVEKGLGEGAGLFAPSLAGLHGCIATAREELPPAQQQQQPQRGRGAGAGGGNGGIAGAHRLSNRGAGASAAAGVAGAGSAGTSGAVAPSALSMTRRFRTHVKQLRHLTVARAVRPAGHIPFPGQPPCTLATPCVSSSPYYGPQASSGATAVGTAPGLRSGGATVSSGAANGTESTKGAAAAASSGGGGGGRRGLGATHVGVGLPPGAAADRKHVRAHLNAALLELMEADLLDALPGYCLPGPVAAVAHAAAVRMVGAAGVAACRALAPSMHHFIMTLPRKRKQPLHAVAARAAAAAAAGGGGAASSSSRGGKDGAGKDGGKDGEGDSCRPSPQVSPRRRRVQTVPVAVDRATNFVLHGVCMTTWFEAPPPLALSSIESVGHDAIFLPRCLCAISVDPLFDTLRAIVLELAGGRAPTGLAATLPSSPSDNVGGGSRRSDPEARAGATAGDAESKRPSSGTSTKGNSGNSALWRAKKGEPPLRESGSEALLTLLAPPAVCAPRGWPFGDGCTAASHPDFPLRPLFEALSVDNIFTVLRALALERPVVVSGSARTAVAMACEALRALLHPLRWHHAYVPLLPAAEVYPFWRLKALEERGDRQSSPPPQTILGGGRSGGGENGGGHGGANGSGETPSGTPSPTRRTRPTQPPRPYFVGLEARLVQAALGEPRDAALPPPMPPPMPGGVGGIGVADWPGSVGRGRGRAPPPPLQPTLVWGVRTRESCLAAAREDPGRCSSHATQPSDATLECTRRIVARAVHVDLDADEVTLPLGASELGMALPPWPAEPLAAAQRRAQLALFPEFYTFDAVTPAVPAAAPAFGDALRAHRLSGDCSGGGGDSGSGCGSSWRQQMPAGPDATRSGGRTAAVDGNGRPDPESAAVREALSRQRSHSSMAAAVAAAGTAATPSAIEGAAVGDSSDSPNASSGGGPKAPVTPPEDLLERMYRPTDPDRLLRAAFLGLLLGVLGRVKEFLTAFPEHGVVRFDTGAFLEAHGCKAWTEQSGAAEFYRELLRTRAWAALLSDEVAADLDLPRVQKMLAENEAERARATAPVPRLSVCGGGGNGAAGGAAVAGVAAAEEGARFGNVSDADSIRGDDGGASSPGGQSP